MELMGKVVSSYYYFITFYSRYFATPLGVIGHASSIYFLTLVSFPEVIKMFPSFLHFIIPVGVTLYIAGTIGGKYFHFRGLPYHTEREVQIQSDPYATMKLLPNMVPLYEYARNESRRQGHDELADRIDDLISNSRFNHD